MILRGALLNRTLGTGGKWGQTVPSIDRDGIENKSQRFTAINGSTRDTFVIDSSMDLEEEEKGAGVLCTVGT